MSDSTRARLGSILDINSVTLDPAKAITYWNDGRRGRAVSLLLGMGLMWLPFAGLLAMTRQFVPQAFAILTTLCSGALIGLSALMSLTLLKRPLAFAAVIIYFLVVIFGAAALFNALMSALSGRTAQFVAGFVLLAIAIAVAMLAIRAFKAASLVEDN